MSETPKQPTDAAPKQATQAECKAIDAEKTPGWKREALKIGADLGLFNNGYYNATREGFNHDFAQEDARAAAAKAKAGCPTR